MNAPLRSLPIRIEPIEGETAEGLMGRLAHAHLLGDADLRRVILEQIERTWWPTAHPRIIYIIEMLADLPEGALRPDFGRHGMRVRCGHHSWRPEKCQKCRRFAEPRIACRTCARGLETTTVARGGAICLTHKQFTYRGLRAGVRSWPEYDQAEQLLRARLWTRGVALHTGEINLAAAFVGAWNTGAVEPNAITERMEKLNVDAPRTYEQTLLCAYPEVIRVAHVLTTPRQITPVLDVTTSALTQADLLSRAVAKAIDGTMNDELRAFTTSVVGHAHRAMLYMYGLRKAPQVKYQLCPLNRALIVAAHRQRACLLRHASPRTLPDIAGRPADAAPRSRVIRTWPTLIDELALQ